MKVAIATDRGQVSQLFGRCPGFTIVEITDGKVVRKDFVENPGYKAHSIRCGSDVSKKSEC